MDQGKVVVRYDKEHDILYIDVRPSARRAAETVEAADDLLIDLDEEGNVIGIELWRASEYLAEPLSSALVERVRKALAD